MLNRCVRSALQLSAIVVLLLASRFVISALEDPARAGQPAEPAPTAPTGVEPQDVEPQATAAAEQAPAPVTEQSYVGSNQCFVCHRPQTDTWSESKHAQAFTHLPEQYRSDNSCLKCHVTAFGESSGYVSGTEKDLLMVGCESCHGPGALHIDAARRFVLATPEDEAKIEKEMRTTVVKTPTDNVCIGCHETQAHGRHPPYRGQPSAELAHAALRPIAGAPAWHFSGYSVKTCASCHYDRYREWAHESHSALAADLPIKYRNDQNCGTCHPTTHSRGASTANGGDPHHGRIGAACETCHGPGLEHVRYNLRFISGPPLSPVQEQAARLSIRKAKPTTSCIQCHVGQSHKQHPEFDKSS